MAGFDGVETRLKFLPLVGVLVISTFLRLVIQPFQFCSFVNVSIISLVPFGMLQFPVLILSLFYLLFLFVHACVKEITVAKKLSALNRIPPIHYLRSNQYAKHLFS